MATPSTNGRSMNDAARRAQEQAVIDALERCGPLTAAEIVRACGLSRGTTYRTLSRLREAKKVRIAKWRRGLNGKCRTETAVYGLGSAPDAVFVPLTKAEIQIRYRRNNGIFEKYRIPPAVGVFGAMAQQLVRQN